MNKVLVTGLGFASDMGICETCSLNFSWLANNPSVILWADRLVMPKVSFEVELMKKEDKNDKVVSMFLEMADNAGMIEKIDLSQMYQERVGEEIYEKMIQNKQKLMSAFPQTIKKGNPGVPHEIIIEDEGYCGAWMSSIYASVKVAEELDANCLFSKREHTFLKYMYGIENAELKREFISRAYKEIFSLYMPEGLAIHNYAFNDEKQCEQCVHYDECKSSYLETTESAFEKMLRWREYDEIHQAKEEINKIVKLKNQVTSEQDIKDIVQQFKERQDVINKNINKRFPKIERWTKMTTVIATPITIAAAVTGNVPLTIGSAVATGVAEATEQLLEVYKSKNNWVGFVNDLKNM